MSGRRCASWARCISCSETVKAAMLKIYNSLTRSKQDFVPIEAGKVRMYVCGMTVYDYCHLGHARVLVVFDMIRRWLKAEDFDVTYVRNITDIDDKIIGRSSSTPTGSCARWTGRSAGARPRRRSRLPSSSRTR